MTIAPPERADALDDAELAQAAARGDRLAFTAIYDRYADRLYDFCAGMLRDRDAAADCVQDVFVIAASKLSQLEDPDRLRAWLYSIARHEALACLKKRRRERPSDELPDIVSGDPDLATIAARHELANLIEEAFGGLSDRDRTVYELAYRHGLDGQELADALGVSHTNARTLLGRVRDGIERSLGALLVCRRAKFEPAACPGLWELLEAWDGVFTVLMRKRVARHIDDCPQPASPSAAAWSIRPHCSALCLWRFPRLRGCEMRCSTRPPPRCRRRIQSKSALRQAYQRHTTSAACSAWRSACTARHRGRGADNPVADPACEASRHVRRQVDDATSTSAQVFSIAGLPPSAATMTTTASAPPVVTTPVRRRARSR